LELEKASSSKTDGSALIHDASTLKLSCTVHGPRPLPRSAAYSPNALISAYVKFAPFATRERRGYLRDPSERDLASHLETALRGVIIADRWPKSGIDITITVLEAEEDFSLASASTTNTRSRGWANNLGMMTVLSGCITVASAAITDAGLDCVDLVSGGVAAIVRQPTITKATSSSKVKNDEVYQIVLDPTPSEHEDVLAFCVVGYLGSRDELTELWMSGDTTSVYQASSYEHGGVTFLVDAAVQAAMASQSVLLEAIKESKGLALQKNEKHLQ
jgi:exosome complex component MTR3